MGTFYIAKNQQAVQGIPIGRLKNLEERVNNISTSTGYQTATGTVDGSNTVFTFSTAPNAICVDGSVYRKQASDGTVNWTGTTTITLSVAPNFDIFAIA